MPMVAIPCDANIDAMIPDVWCWFPEPLCPVIAIGQPPGGGVPDGRNSVK